MTYSRALARAVKANRGYGGGILHIATEGSLIFAGAAGYADAGRTMPITDADTFEIASVTKAFTAAVVLQLVDEGRVDLDAPLATYLPAVLVGRLLVVGGRDLGPALTVRQLLSQRSGLPDYWSDPPFVEPETNAFLRAFLADVDRLWSPAEILAFVPGLAPIAAPGQAFHYGDTNFLLLALVIEALDLRPLHAALRARIFQPLGLRDTYLSYREAPVATQRESDRWEGKLDLHGRPHQSADWGGGGLVSSARDLATFLFALAGGRLLSAASLALMHSWQTTDHGEQKRSQIAYGLGLYRINLGAAGSLWGHDGHGNAFMYYWPERGVALTGTLNQTENDWWPMVEAAIGRLAATGLPGQ